MHTQQLNAWQENLPHLKDIMGIIMVRFFGENPYAYDRS